MKKSILLVVLIFLSAIHISAQEVISANGETSTVGSNQISWTVGEVIVETVSFGTTVLTQGFHQSKLTVTAIDNLFISGVEIKVYPNPTQDFVNINFNKMPDNAVYRVFDLSGKLLEQKSISSNSSQVDMTRFAGGQYILKLSHKNQQALQTFKIVKK